RGFRHPPPTPPFRDSPGAAGALAHRASRARQRLSPLLCRKRHTLGAVPPAPGFEFRPAVAAGNKPANRAATHRRLNQISGAIGWLALIGHNAPARHLEGIELGTSSGDPVDATGRLPRDALGTITQKTLGQRLRARLCCDAAHAISPIKSPAR